MPFNTTRRAVIGSMMGTALGAAAAPLAAQTRRDWTGKEPIAYPDPDIVIVDPKRFKYRANNAAIERVFTGCRWAEGPAWNGNGQYVVWSDIPNNRQLRRLEEDGHCSVMRPDSHYSNGNTFDYQGRQLSCEHDARRVVRYEPNGKVTVIADKWQGKPLNAPNDIVVAKNGHAYFTDPAFGNQQDHRELDFYGVYHLPAKGPLKLVAKAFGRPNGVALSPNGRVLYVVNSDERNVRAYDVDRSGETSNERVLIANLPGVPGGIRTDEKGNLYVAGKGMTIYSGDGKLLHTMELKNPAANCGFGEPDLKTLFIATGPEVLRARLDVKGAY